MCVFSWGEILYADKINFVGNILLSEEIDFLVEGIQFWVCHVATDIWIYKVTKMTPPGRFMSKVYQVEQL